MPVNETTLKPERQLSKDFAQYVEEVKKYLINKYGEISLDNLKIEADKTKLHDPYSISNEELAYHAVINKLQFELADKPEVYKPRGKASRKYSPEATQRQNGKRDAKVKLDNEYRIRRNLQFYKLVKLKNKTLPYSVFYERKFMDTFMKYHKVSVIKGSHELVIPPYFVNPLFPFSGVVTNKYKEEEIIPPPLFRGVVVKQRKHPTSSAAYTLQEVRAYAEALIEAGIERHHIDTDLSRKFIKRLLWQTRENVRKNYEQSF